MHHRAKTGTEGGHRESEYIQKKNEEEMAYMGGRRFIGDRLNDRSFDMEDYLSKVRSVHVDRRDGGRR